MNNRCEWMIAGKGKGASGKQQCPARAEYAGPTAVKDKEAWLLCEFHKSRLLEAYNEQSRREQAPLWKYLS